MAICSFVFCNVGPDVPAPYNSGATSEEETIGSAVATAAAATQGQTYCEVTAEDACYVSFGSSPDASTDNPRYYMPAGSTRYFRVGVGDKASVSST